MLQKKNKNTKAKLFSKNRVKFMSLYEFLSFFFFFLVLKKYLGLPFSHPDLFSLSFLSVCEKYQKQQEQADLRCFTHSPISTLSANWLVACQSLNYCLYPHLGMVTLHPFTRVLLGLFTSLSCRLEAGTKQAFSCCLYQSSQPLFEVQDCYKETFLLPGSENSLSFRGGPK